MEISADGNIKNDIRILYSELTDGTSQHLVDKIVHPVWKRTLTDLGILIKNGIPDNFLQNNICKQMFVRTGWQQQQDVELKYIKSTKKELFNRILSIKEPNLGGIDIDCKEMNISVNTLGMIWYYARIQEQLMQNPQCIVEFGGGFGSLARLFRLMSQTTPTYIIIDLPEMLMLQYFYLSSTLGRSNIHLVKNASDKIIHGKINLISIYQIEFMDFEADLFISTFALSETSQFTQDMICREKCFFKAKHLYITGQDKQEMPVHNWNSPQIISDSAKRLFETVKVNPFHIGNNYELTASDSRKSVELPKAIVLMFSKDRAMQLDATLHSFILHCLDFHQVNLRIIVTASNEKFAKAYQILEQEYSSNSNISFIPENDFRTQVLNLLKSDEYVLFLVDDNMFVKDFSMAEYQQVLENNQDALGYSLRLGKNTTYFYMLDKPQLLPIFKQLTADTLKYDWTSANYDFGYPLEISSSFYRTKDMIRLLAPLPFHNPNSLEAEMANQTIHFQKSHQYLLCSNTSVTFCNPINKVQNTYQQNRAGKSNELTADSLLVKYMEGQRIDVSTFNGFFSNACHQEVTPTFIENTNARPKVSVIIPCYKQAHLMTNAVESIVNQSFHNWEIIIVNDGSPDNTTEIANELICKFSEKKIRLIQKPNGGLSDARNFGIKAAQGSWILPLDSDDLFHKDFLLKAVDIINNNPDVNLVYCNMQEFGARTGEWIPTDYSPKTLLKWDTFPYASLYKKELWEKSGGYYVGIPWGAEDWDFWIGISKLGLKPVRIPEKLFIYRTTGDSMYDKMLPFFNEVTAFIKTLHPDLYGESEITEAINVIRNMSEDSHGKLLEIIEKHPDLSMPYFWLSLISRLNIHPDTVPKLLETSKSAAKKEGAKATERLNKLLEYQLPSKYSISEGQESSFVDNLHHKINTGITPKTLHSENKYGEKNNLTISIVASVGNINPHGSNGGLETATIKTAESLADIGHSVAIVANGKTKEEVCNGVKYITFDNWKNKKYPEYLSKIDILAFASGPDLRSYDYVDNRIPKVVLFHHQQLEFIRGVDAKSLLNKTANAVICVSNQVCNNLTGSGIAINKLNVIHNGIDLSTFYSRGVARNPFRIMFVGAHVPEKNPHLLIEVFLELEKKFKNVELHLYGSAALWGSEEYLNRQQINERSANIYFHGCVSQQELAIAYSSSSLCVIPSTYESFSLVSLEAQACGCIPLAHNVGGISETMIHGKTGYLYTPNNAATLYQSLNVLLENISAVTVIRENAEKWVKENFSWEKTALQYQEIFYNVLKTAGDNHKITAGINVKENVPQLVSVVIPCYNYARYLPEAVESVVRQTYTNWEIIIVNDGSTDNTKKVAEGLIVKYAKQKIQLINQANSGQPSAVRNAGIAVAQGEFILPLDADDKIAPTFLEKTVAVLKDSPKIGVAYTHIQHFGTLKSVYQCGTFCTETLVRDNILPYASLYRRRLWEETGGYRTNVGYEDWDFWLTLAEKGVLGLLVPEPLFFYRKHGVSRLGADNDRRNQMVAQLYTNHPKLYSSEQVEDARKYLASLTGSIGKLGGINVGSRHLRITYLISSILGVTGGNQTLLNQSNAMVRKGHSVTIVTYTDKPAFMQVLANVIRVPDGDPMSKYVPASDVVVGTYFLNALELKNITAKVKIYFAQGDQFVFEDSSAKLSTAQKKQLRDWKQLSKESYRQTDVKFIANSINLANAVENKYGRKADAIVPVCIDQTIFRPLQRSLLNTKPRILIVGPDIKGSAMEPLTFKGIGDIRIALEKLIANKTDFTAVRMSNSTPEIFKDFPCEFYAVPNDELKTFLYGSATILVYASHYDSCPIPPLEAMAAGAAVVCTATTGAIEYCRTEENCLLVPIQSPDELCKAIQRLLDDPLLRKKLIRGGFITAKQYPREREWDEMEQLFFQYLQGKQKERRVPAISNDGKIFKEIHTRLSNKQFNDVLSMTDAMPLETKQTGNEEVLIMQGCAHLGLRDLEKAKICFEHALEVNPKSSEACSGLGEVFFLAEMDKESKIMFEWAVVNDVENMNARKGLAKTNKVLQLNSANNSLLDPGIDDMIEKAEGKINCGEIDEARAILAEALNLDKYHLDALNDLSVCNIIDNNIEKALELIAIILTIDPENEIAVDNITLINQQTSEVISD